MKEIIDSIVKDTKNGKAVTIVSSSLLNAGGFHIFRSALKELKVWEEYRCFDYLNASIYENTEHRLRLIVLPVNPNDNGYAPDKMQPSKKYMHDMAHRCFDDSDRVYMLKVGVNIVG